MRLACYQPEIALNVGAMMRTCACFDAGLDIIEPCGFAFSVQAVKRSAMDYAQHVDIVRHASWDQFCESTQGRLILLTTRSQTPYWSFEFSSDDVLLVGQESAGVPQEVHAFVQHHATIPTNHKTRSLNVATAAAIVLSEARRQLLTVS